MTASLFKPVVRRRAMTVLGRLSQRRNGQRDALVAPALRRRMDDLIDAGLDAAIEADQGMGEVLTTVLRERPSKALAYRVMMRCAERRLRGSVSLRELALEATRQCVESEEPRAAQPSTDVRAGHVRGALGEPGDDLASLMNDYGVRLADAGRLDEAEQALRRTVHIRRSLADDNAAVAPGLATSLHNLGDVLLELGRLQEALDRTREAIRIRRDLVTDEDLSSHYDLGVSLLHESELLHRLGQASEALEASAEASRQFDWLAAKWDRYRVEQASALGAHARDLRAAGDLDRAAEALERTAAVRSDLANEDPAVHRPQLANTLLEMGRLAGQVGDDERALALSEQAVAIRQELADAHPSFVPDLAQAFDHQAIAFNRAGEPRKAWACANKAVATYTALVDSSLRSRRSLARALLNRGAIEVQLGRYQEAEKTVGKAVEDYRSSEEAEPTSAAEGLALALRDWSAILAINQRYHVALDAASEAASLFKTLADREPLAFLLDHVQALNTLGLRHADLEHHQAACETLQAALDLLRDAGRDGLDWRKAEVMCLNNLGAFLEVAGQHDEAYRVIRDAAAVLGDLAKRWPAMAVQHASALRNLAWAARQTERPAAALAAARESVAIWQRAFRKDPEAARHSLANAHAFLANRLAENEQVSQAVGQAETGLALLRQIQEPSAAIDLASALADLGAILQRASPEQARAPLMEALDGYRTLARPADDTPHFELLEGLDTLATSLVAIDERRAALDALETAVTHAAWLAERHPGDGLPRWIQCSFRLAAILAEGRRDSDALPMLEAAAARLPELLHHRPDVVRTVAVVSALHLQAVVDAGVSSDEIATRLTAVTAALKEVLAATLVDE